MRDILRLFRRTLVSRLIRSVARQRQLPTLGKTLVIAPHPDDETFGCGGLIALKHARQIPVDLTFLTTGEASHNNCCQMNQAKLGEARRSQARAVAGILGVPDDHIHWLGMRDGSIPAKDSSEFNRAVDQLAQVMRQVMPDEIYCPHPLDCWPDHEAAVRIVLQATRVSGLPPSCGRFGGAGRSQVYFYLVWGWYGMQFRRLPKLGFSNVRQVDISSVLEAKLAAVNHYVGSHPPGCPNPYVGALPKGFLKPFMKPYEIFFESKGLG